MIAFIVSFIVGVICVIIGFLNRKGRIEMLHSYHRHRVEKKDRVPFGKKVGLGMILVGVSITVYSALSAVTLLTERDIYSSVGTAVFGVGILLGLGIIVQAMNQYNKGIF